MVSPAEEALAEEAKCRRWFPCEGRKPIKERALSHGSPTESGIRSRGPGVKAGPRLAGRGSRERGRLRVRGRYAGDGSRVACPTRSRAHGADTWPAYLCLRPRLGQPHLHRSPYSESQYGIRRQASPAAECALDRGGNLAVPAGADGIGMNRKGSERPSILPPRPAKLREGWGEGHVAPDSSSQPCPRRTEEKGPGFLCHVSVMPTGAGGGLGATALGTNRAGRRPS
jgi:hypothetical protein